MVLNMEWSNMVGSLTNNKLYNIPVVLVVHCVDSEGPIGGDVRKNPDGTKEFMDNWDDILYSLNEITCEDFRKNYTDSFGEPYSYNWFIMDFTGFKTNPKNRIQKYNDTYDNIKSLNTSPDGFYWHDHHVPSSGIGDHWSNDWLSSNEHLNILANRLIDRRDFPEAFRAGGTIEDNNVSVWLEENLMIDYSNRVSYKSFPTDNIFDFNWHGAPDHWGFYHPSKYALLKPGDMRRYIVKCVDLKSRFHLLQQWEVDECFRNALTTNRPIILSYFSHDHRDMREETYYALDLIKTSSAKYKVPWKTINPVDAIQIADNIERKQVRISISFSEKQLVCNFSDPIYQKSPFVAVKEKSGRILPLNAILENNKCIINIKDSYQEIGIACTSISGNKALKLIKI